jgi:hypothetical protein
MATKKSGTEIKNCTFTQEAFKPTPEMMDAVSRIAVALEANAFALKALAERITGPMDNRIALKIGQ